MHITDRSSVVAKPLWLWWIVFAIYSFFCIASFLQYALALSAWAIPRSLLLLAPIALFGFVRQVPILKREVWVVYFVVACGFAAYGLLGMFVPAAMERGRFIAISTTMLPIMVAWVLMWSLPVLYALWAYAFRSPHIGRRGPLLAA